MTNCSKYFPSRKRRNEDSDLSTDEASKIASSFQNEGRVNIPNNVKVANTNGQQKTKCEFGNTRNDMKRQLSNRDFNKTSIDLAKYLLGKYLVHNFKGEHLIGRIVETEAYPGVTDAASHSYGEKRTERTKPMFMREGTSYVYFIYGMYCCMNISSTDVGGAVLLRALEPVQGIDSMHCYRSEKRKETSQPLKPHQVCNGPAKLCQAMKIDKMLNAVDMTTCDVLYIEEEDDSMVADENIVVCKRIGIAGYGEAAASQPYRLYIKGNKNISVRDKKAELGNV